jgi:hypothetical protein
MDASLRINANKCHFDARVVRLLGHLVIPSVGILPNPSKVTAITTWPTPQSSKELQSFLGLARFIADSVRFMPEITAPLNCLASLAGKMLFAWDDTAQQHFAMLQQAIATVPMRSFPDFALRFSLTINASDIGIGFMLYQDCSDAKDKINILAFGGRSLTKHQCHYRTFKKELLAIVWAIRRNHMILAGRHFTLHMDHRALTFLFTQMHTNHIIENWLETLLSYSFDIVHIPGFKNIAPDTLSRRYTGCAWGINDPTHIVQRDTIAALMRSDSNAIAV